MTDRRSQYEPYATVDEREGDSAPSNVNIKNVDKLCRSSTLVIVNIASHIIFGIINIALLVCVMAWIQRIESRLESVVDDVTGNLAPSSQKTTEISKRMDEEYPVLSPPCEQSSTSVGCFWLSTTDGGNMTYYDGVAKCREGRSFVARVKNQADYDLVMTKLRRHWKPSKSGKTYANAWINGTIDATKFPGMMNQDLYIKWFPYGGYPKRERERTHLTLYADKRGVGHEGMVNRSPDTRVSAVTCFFVPA